MCPRSDCINYTFINIQENLRENYVAILFNELTRRLTVKTDDKKAHFEGIVHFKKFIKIVQFIFNISNYNCLVQNV